MTNKKRLFSAIFSALVLAFASHVSAGSLFQENFEDANFSTRGWYDNTAPKLSSVEHVANSTKSLEFHFTKGAVTPDNTCATRRK